ncbi:MAG: biotin--[acetyl-CoA-carboxylase] ligase [Nitrospirota bacterium]|nr:biotin--[acetyl-CoA-carboxylase] ligase [Nitrospirota bacterium]
MESWRVGVLRGLLPEDLQSLAAFQEETDLYRFSFYDSVSSTNDVALKLAREGNPHGTVVIADSQERGRGRHGRTWYSPPGVNIYMSIILNPGVITFHPALVTLSASLAVVNAVNSCLLSQSGAGTVAKVPSVEVWPKWPNDIYCNHRKLGGILTEASTARERIRFMVAGIGMNVNMQADQIPPDFRDNTTSLYSETGEVFDRGRVIVKILESFSRYYTLLFNDPASVIARWCKISHTINSYVKAVTPQGEIYGTALGLDDRGFLRLGKEGGEEVCLNTAEIVHLRDHDR